MKLKSLNRYLLSFFLIFVLGATSLAEKPAAEVPNEIFQFMEKSEPDFGWKELQVKKTDHGTIHFLELTSQRWQNIVWKHALVIYEPAEVVHNNHMLLFVTGGRIGGAPRDKELEMGLALANRCRARVATLHQVPNQPLLGDHVEDDLITETWLKYLKTEDPSWPLLFPMVKSAVKAMDALQEFAKENGNPQIDGFVITGASKRGWTSWLTPVVDERIVATAPIVIDVLNFTVQMQNQKDTWGKYSDQIADYTSKGLVHESGNPETPQEERLWKMMDPYTYRERLKLPKLLVVGTNDPYWVVDAMKHYWFDLAGPKYCLQVPNAGHGLDGGREHALTTIAVYFQHVVSNTPLPKIEWSFEKTNGNDLVVNVKSDQKTTSIQLWQATSIDKDFRPSEWTSSPISRNEGQLVIPEKGHVATFVEFRFEAFGIPYSLTSLVHVE